MRDKRMIYIVLIICAYVSVSVKKVLADSNQAFVASGPTKFLPCRGEWLSHCNSATNWFEIMGYPVDRMVWPTKQEVEERLINLDIELFYLAGHGDETHIKLGCLGEEMPEIISVEDIEQWLESRPPIKFTFYMACNGSCQSEERTMSYALTKGYQSGSAFISFCGMDQEECIDCWNNLGFWQYDLFNYLSQKETIGQSFDLAMDENPMCQNCIFLEGDADLKLVETEEPSICGNNLLEQNEACDYQGIVEGKICVECLEEIDALPDDYNNENDCIAANYYWYDDACHRDPKEKPEPICGNDILEEGEICDYQVIVEGMICLNCLEEVVAQASDYNNQLDCENASFYWYDDVCHSDPYEEPEPEVIFGDVYPKETYGDDKVDLFDLLNVIDFILTREKPEQWQAIRADVPNGTPIIACLPPDQEINVMDLMVMIGKILTRSNCIDEY